MKETWRDIKGYEKKYQISNFGRVKRLSRPIRSKSYTKKTGKIITGDKILNPIKNGTGYYSVNLGKNSIMKMYSIHRLVAIHFIKNYKNKKQVNHINGIKTDNNVKNLEWATASENGLHSYRVLKIIPWSLGKKGKNNPASKPVVQKTLDGKIIKIWECALIAVREKGFDSGCISRCCSGQNKYHKNFIWEYLK